MFRVHYTLNLNILQLKRYNQLKAFNRILNDLQVSAWCYFKEQTPSPVCSGIFFASKYIY